MLYHTLAREQKNLPLYIYRYTTAIYNGSPPWQQERVIMTATRMLGLFNAVYTEVRANQSSQSFLFLDRFSFSLLFSRQGMI